MRVACALAAAIGLQAVALAQNVIVAPPGIPAQQRAVNVTNGPRGMVQFLTSGNASTITLPVSPTGRPGFSRQSGMQLNVDLHWPGQYGYQPVAFTLTLQKPAVADRRVKLTFSAGDWSNSAEGISVEQSFVFPAGATSATEKLIVPRLQTWQLATWRVNVDGASDDFLAVDDMYLANLNAAQAGLGVIALGLSPQEQGGVSTILQGASNGSGANLRTMKGQDLPTNWIEYSTLDVFVMPADELPRLAADHPQQTEALLRWVRSGGNLWLTEGGRWQRLAKAERTLSGKDAAGDPSTGTDEPTSEDELFSQGWVFAPTGDRSAEPAEGALLLSGFDSGADNDWGKQLARVVPDEGTAQRKYLVRGYGLGVVTAFRVDLPGGFYVNGAEDYSAITQSLLGPRMVWSMRHGNQPEMASNDFNNLLIPNVGVAPVGQFQFLITLFVIVIGPLNYWLLKSKNKLPLLLATAPAAAAATTLLLFSYGIVADGFDVQARARTLTLLDQRAGEAASWGRLSYYAGIAPRVGLSVPRDQLMYPIMPRWAAGSYGGPPRAAPRKLTWGEEQRLTRGWLASRTPTQYQAIASRPSKKRLELRATDAGLRIVNRLGVDVTHVAMEDHDGKAYWCEDLPDGAGRVVTATDRDDLASNIRKLFTANLPESPGGDEVGYNSYYGSISLSQSLMEGRLEAINSSMVRSWGPGKYIAFTKQAIELDLGLDDITEEASFHVIEGSW